uniref:ZP domain-containing protein n=1 Tax=Cyprinus carpio TaxID=7962 RepID=A0A8C2C007_CYPCA
MEWLVPAFLLWNEHPDVRDLSTFNYCSYYSYGMCDFNVEWNGWYRLFYNGQNTQMPDSCVHQGMCGTYEPLWLNGSHPQLGDEVVIRQVCASTWSDCCGYKSHPIRVKACPGNYYVYEFVKTPFCTVYCADPCAELNCTEDEWCGEKNSVYGCLCNENQTRPDSLEGLISREKILKLSFSCVYPQTQTLSINVEINPLGSSIKISGMKMIHLEHFNSVRMTPYEDEEFTRPFTGRVDAELDQKMNVEVRVEGVDSRQFASVMDMCWATPVNDPDYSLRWDLIVTECPNPTDDTVELLQNGVSTSSRFSFRMFIFTANSTKLYLHCAAHLCLLSSNRCSTVYKSAVYKPLVIRLVWMFNVQGC